MVKIKDFTGLVDELAPPKIALDFDNCGLLVGSADACIDRVLFALEVSSGVINEAIEKRCGLIVTHHPLIFKAEKQITDKTYQGGLLLKMIAGGMALYSAHTPLDGADGGCNDVLCGLFLVKNASGIDYMCHMGGRDYFCARIGNVDVSLNELAKSAEKTLKSKRVQVVACSDRVRRIAICSGAGGACIDACIEAGADCLLTGELSYHEALRLKEAGVSAVVCGHYETEIPVLDHLIAYLQERISVLQYDVDLVKAKTVTNPYI